MSSTVFQNTADSEVYTASQHSDSEFYAASANGLAAEPKNSVDGILWGLVISAPLWMTIGGAIWVAARTLG
jgi:hypothetical protein